MMSDTRKVVTRERPFVFEATGVGFSRNERDEVRRAAFVNPLALVELPARGTRTRPGRARRSSRSLPGWKG